VQSLVRALHIVNRIATSDEGLTLTRISEEVDLAASTVHRLLTTLEQEQYVHFDPEKRRWLIGVQTFVAGNAFLKTRDLVAVARPYMRALMEESRETVKLAVEDKGEAVFLSQSEGPRTPTRQATACARAPLYCSGAGKALLSGKTLAELSKFLRGEGRRRLTVNTIVSGPALHDDIMLARERAYAVDNEELAIGLRCVAAPVFNEFREPVGAISISGPAGRILQGDIPRLGNLARRRAEQITAKLGGTRPDPFR
jgi:IclR family acetate operon transcriptional repressor